MKKILLLFLTLLILPAYTANWKEIGEKQYVDLDSIEKYNDIYKIQSDGRYSFWIKRLNDKSSYFIDSEKSYNKKIWYELQKTLIDCKNKTIASKAFVMYDLNEEVIDTYEWPDYSINWSSIVPDSVGESYYYGICPR